jgi:hypothetical protein
MPTSAPPLLAASSGLLRQMFDEERCLFAYSTRLSDDGLVNDFSHPAVHRYTINTLAGLQNLARFHDTDWDTADLVERFIAGHLDAVTNEADRGLLLAVATGEAHEAQTTLFEWVEAAVGDQQRMLGLDVQDVCWMLMGLARYAEVSGEERAAAAAAACFAVLNRRFLDRDTLLPSHRLARYRRGLVSFGGIAYFLRALSDYATVFGDRYAETIFAEGVGQVIGLQGEQGEWPWFIDSSSARIVDRYQLYSVHQDSMAMLFLLPAHDRGIVEARPSIERSYRWLFGANELGVRMVVEEPFFIYRSIRRKCGRERERRYARALLSKTLRRESGRARPESLEVNTECRSYHIGWLVFAWAGRSGFEELTELQLL